MALNFSKDLGIEIILWISKKNYSDIDHLQKLIAQGETNIKKN